MAGRAGRDKIFMPVLRPSLPLPAEIRYTGDGRRTDAEYGSCVILRQNMCERANEVGKGRKREHLHSFAAAAPLGSSDENIEPFEGMERQRSFTEDIAAPDKNVVCPQP